MLVTLAPTVLCVCTGNLCRSVSMALYLEKAWGEDARVASAGTYAMEGWEVPEIAQELLAHDELDASDHEPTQLTTEAIQKSDLVLVAASDHRAWISQRCGELPPHVFLLTEAAALTVFARRPQSPDRSERIREAALSLAAARAMLSDVRQKGIPDPTGLSYGAYERALRECKEGLDTITAWIG